ncbi:MAG: hypothetical protein K6E64_03805 [Lachnospiraceae bacterium]|nr:hypothetical protein [Lachnospiraceae bacterium]
MRKTLNYQGIEYYRLNELLKEHPTCEYIAERKDLANMVFSFYGERYVTAEGWNEFEKQIMLSEEYYNPANVADKYKYRSANEDIYLYPVLNKAVLTCEHNGCLYYKKKDVDSLPDISAVYSKAYGIDLVPVSELVRHHNDNRLYGTGNIVFSSRNIRYLYSSKELFKTPYQDCVYGKYADVCREFEYRCERYKEEEWFENILGGFKPGKKITYDLLKKHYVSEINHSKSAYRESVAKRFIASSKKIYESINREIFALSESEIYQRIGIGIFCEKYDVKFLNYIQSEYPDFCAGVNFRIRTNNVYSSGGAYVMPAEDFAELYDASVDVKRHLKNACEDYMYARYWLFVLVLLVNFERGKDVVNMPILDLPYEYDLSSIEKNGLSNAEIIFINKVFGIEAKGILSSKRLKKKDYYTTTEILPALAYAIYICNTHAKEMGALNLFDARKGYSSERILNKLGPEFEGINSRTLNYTLAYYFEKTGDQATQYRKDVYRYLSILRGHMMETPMSISAVTACYIKSLAENDNVEEMARGIIEKGPFGWMYIALLNAAECLPNNTNMEVQAVVNARDIFRPSDAEQISKFYLNIDKEREECLLELKKYNKSIIQDFIANLGKIGTFRDESRFPCLFANACPHKEKQCRYCEFSVKTLLAMETYEDELKKIVKQLKETGNDVVRKKNLYLFTIILNVFNDFQKMYGKDVLEALIDVDELHDLVRLVDSLEKE